MKKMTKLSRAEMKNVLGGNFPTCTIICYIPASGGTTTVTFANPSGGGCFNPPVSCPPETSNVSCSCN